jgi:hypothetical protein
MLAHMDIEPFIDTLRQDLAVAAEAGGSEARALSERLTAPLETATRLVLLEALTRAAEEISLELAPGSVEVRLRGRDPEFVVSAPAPTPLAPTVAAMAPPVPTDDDSGTARLNLRLPESLKQAIDAAASAEGLSLNAWLLRAATAALASGSTVRPPASTGQRFTGWAR